jgi:sec-independent protein translocase protein TatC
MSDPKDRSIPSSESDTEKSEEQSQDPRDPSDEPQDVESLPQESLEPEEESGELSEPDEVVIPREEADDLSSPSSEEQTSEPSESYQVEEPGEEEGEEESLVAAEGSALPAATDSGDEKPPEKPRRRSVLDDDEEPELGGRMTFLEHLDELRKRIMRSVIAVVVTFCVAWIFREQIYGFLAVPIHEVVEKLVVIKPTEPFTIYLKVSFTAAIFLAAPFILSQVWLFIAPGLYRKEKIYAFPFLFFSTALFVLGGVFAYYVILPPALNFLLLEFGAEFQPMISAVEFYDFELLIIIGMGVIFQLPVLVAFLSIFGLITPGFLWRNFRYAFLLITIVAAIVSPTTDPFNLFLWSGPMVILYGISIAISWVFQFRRKRAAKRAAKAEGGN